MLSLPPKSAGPVRCGRTPNEWQVLPAGFGAGPGQFAGPNGKPDGFIAGSRDQKQKAKETENWRRQKLRRACPVSRRLLRGWFNNGLIRRSARLPLPNYGPPTRAPVDSILWWLGSVVMAMLSARQNVRQKTEARQCQQGNSGAQWPIKISVVKIRVCVWNSYHDTDCDGLHPIGECKAKAADNCCDDGWCFCFHSFVVCANAA